jgi:hypothetical protein
MTRANKGKYAEKYPSGRTTNPLLVKAVKDKADYGVIPCASAIMIAEEMNVPTEEIGFTIDMLEIRISKCQLGLFGNTPISKITKAEENIDKELQQAILDKSIDNRLPCAAAWELAKLFKIPKIKIAGACEALKLKISNCQLNAF